MSTCLLTPLLLLLPPLLLLLLRLLLLLPWHWRRCRLLLQLRLHVLGGWCRHGFSLAAPAMTQKLLLQIVW